MDFDLPPGLDRAILRSILRFHKGRENAISRPKMLKDLASLGFPVDDRQMRACINELRKQGYLICSCGGCGGGYYIPANWDELTEYFEHELRPRAMDLLSQEKAMREQAEKTWGQYGSIQMRF